MKWVDLKREEKVIKLLWIWILIIVPLYIITQRLPKSDSIVYVIFNKIITLLYAPCIFFPFVIWGLSKKNKREKIENNRVELLRRRYKEYAQNYFDENKRDIANGIVLDCPNEFKEKNIKKYALFLVGMDYIYVDEEEGWDYITQFTKNIKITQGRLNTLFGSHFLVEKLYESKKRCFLLALDTNIVSYIKRYMDGTLEKHLYPIINSLKKCKGENVEINIDAYILENCILDLNIANCQFENILQAYYFIYSINHNPKIAKLKAEEKLNKLKMDFERCPHDLCKKHERYSYVYCVLLKVIILKFEKGTLKEKSIRLINFMNEKTCTLDPAFANLAYVYWEKGQHIKFFGTIQRKRKDILKQIRNMAWDIYHLFNTSLSYQKENDLTTLYYPIFYTNDNRLADIAEGLKIQSLAIDNIQNQVFPHYIDSVWKKILTEEEQYNYLSYDKLRERNARRKEVDTKELYEKLEIKLLDLLDL